MFKASAYPAATWGHPSCGISPTTMGGFERDALAAAGLTKPGRCLTTGLIAHYGVLGTPRARTTRETIFNYFSVLQMPAVLEHLGDLRIAWSKAYTDLVKRQYPSNHITGLLTNVMCILIEAGWNPRFYNMWYDENGKRHDVYNMSMTPWQILSPLPMVKVIVESSM